MKFYNYQAKSIFIDIRYIFSKLISENTKFHCIPFILTYQSETRKSYQDYIKSKKTGTTLIFDTDNKWWFISAIIKWLMTGWREFETRDRERREVMKNVEQKRNVNIYVFTSSFSPEWGLLAQECVYPNVNWTRYYVLEQSNVFRNTPHI